METNVESALVAEVKKLNTVLNKLMRRQSFRYSFFAGLISGLGYVIGTSLVIALLLYLLSRAEVIPVIGDWVKEIANSLPQK